MLSVNKWAVRKLLLDLLLDHIADLSHIVSPVFQRVNDTMSRPSRYGPFNPDVVVAGSLLKSQRMTSHIDSTAET